jgi:hypothetical protein
MASEVFGYERQLLRDIYFMYKSPAAGVFAAKRRRWIKVSRRNELCLAK